MFKQTLLSLLTLFITCYTMAGGSDYSETTRKDLPGSCDLTVPQFITLTTIVTQSYQLDESVLKNPFPFYSLHEEIERPIRRKYIESTGYDASIASPYVSNMSFIATSAIYDKKTDTYTNQIEGNFYFELLISTAGVETDIICQKIRECQSAYNTNAHYTEAFQYWQKHYQCSQHKPVQAHDLPPLPRPANNFAKKYDFVQSMPLQLPEPNIEFKAR